jgi:hypothetical protein
LPNIVDIHDVHFGYGDRPILVKQFVHAETDGPVPFHYPGKALAEDLGLRGPQ